MLQRPIRRGVRGGIELVANTGKSRVVVCQWRRRHANAPKSTQAKSMHFATLIPDWNSLDSVRHVHSDLEAAALVFFALLVLFDILAHLSTDDKKKTLLEKIGLCCFAIAVLAEVVAYPYGQRNDTLSAQVIGSLDAKSREASTNASSALTKSGEAETKADAAETASGKAVAESSSAMTIASGARQEADSFENDIKSAKTKAAEAESHLAEALKQAADATAELQRLRAPRSLVEVPKLIADLRVFNGTEYRLNVFQDDESIQFTKIVDDALNRAGWLRKPSPYKLGIASILIFGKDREQAVPVCIETGIQIHFWADESLAVLNARPLKDQSPALQAAVALRLALVSHIAPTDNRNVGDKVSLDENSEDKFPLVICIGKKRQ
jgi:hypothetical protein